MPYVDWFTPISRREIPRVNAITAMLEEVEPVSRKNTNNKNMSHGMIRTEFWINNESIESPERLAM
jgi:hypothetical protein